jgi:Flp pilus assembly pilin Flp
VSQRTEEKSKPAHKNAGYRDDASGLGVRFSISNTVQNRNAETCYRARKSNDGATTRLWKTAVKFRSLKPVGAVEAVALAWKERPVKNLLRLLGGEQGQDIAEYAVMLAVILVLVVGTVRLIGSNANTVFSNAASSIQ